MQFEHVFHAYKENVFNLALQYTQQVEDAEEIMQDVFLKVHEKYHQFREESALSTWIYKITVNQSLDFLKAKKARKRWFLFRQNQAEDVNWEQSSVEMNHPGVLLEYKERTEQIFQAINQLPDSQKTVLILLKIEGLSQKEVAAIMEKSEKGVESLFQRAKANLKNLLETTEG